ncbi:uncharacterized protein N7458_000959 [Penicillium daleae]|uniref:Uncharacterized protein n=1 Tax=Penicillium daleae TaxID=63821 RepID=A0AAD6CH49_9EURO|nr:uncharacterized protein N7458_000959 [Penicillium daleae]KAJ5465273.1 hypothetical protein N7458_000959 [Penicillium daleae]
MAPGPHGSIRHKDKIELAMAHGVLDISQAKLENSPIEPVMESLDVHLVAIGICSTGEFARCLRHLAPCFELSATWLQQRVPEMALLDDAVPFGDGILGGLPPRKSIEQSCIAPAEASGLYFLVVHKDRHRFL